MKKSCFSLRRDIWISKQAEERPYSCLRVSRQDYQTLGYIYWTVHRSG